MNYSQTYGFLTDARAGISGTITSTWGTLSASASFSTPQLAAVHVTGVLLSEDIWVDSPTVRAAIQASDVNFGSAISSTVLTLRLIPDAGLSVVSSAVIDTHAQQQQGHLVYALFSHPLFHRHISLTAG